MPSPTTRAALGLALGQLAAATAAAADPPADVKVGDKAPAFEARNEADKTWTSSDNFGKDGKVAYKNTKVNPTDDARKVIDFVTGARR